MARAARFEERVVVVTGAGRGIGRATALAFARQGAKLACCDVDETALEEVLGACGRAGARATLGARVDVAENAELVAFAERVERDLGPTFGLINNAGVAVAGGFFATTLEDWRYLLDVNLFGAIHGTRAFAPGMSRRGQGFIVNVASAAGFCNLPALTAYGTSKYALLGLSEALRLELRPHGVTVGVVCPGFVNTSIIESARVRGAEDLESARQALRDFYRDHGHRPELVASAIVRAARRGTAVALVTPEAHVLYALKRFLPAAVPSLLAVAERWRGRRSP